jgi:hypothetical protein
LDPLIPYGTDFQRKKRESREQGIRRMNRA